MNADEMTGSADASRVSARDHEDVMEDEDEIVVNTSGIVADDESGGHDDDEPMADSSFMANNDSLFLSPAPSKQRSSGHGSSSFGGDAATPDVVASGGSSRSSARSKEMPAEEPSPLPSRKAGAAKKPAATKKRGLKAADINDDGTPRKRPATKKSKAPLPPGRQRRVSVPSQSYSDLLADRILATKARHRKQSFHCPSRQNLLTESSSPRWTSAAATMSATTTTRCSST